MTKIKFRLPTLPEVVQSGICLIGGHDWDSDGICKDCGAER